MQMDSRPGTNGSHDRPIQLSPRQREVLTWTAQGKTTWEIAVIMQCAEATVNYHLKQIFRKLEATNKPHVVSRALSLGLLSGISQ
jgi:DNA-binding CsgD family transcriptional regulator